MVVTRWTARGTHVGEFQGIPPTGREVRVAGTDIDRIIDGKTVECWVQMDQLGLMQQLGAIAAG
jgi:predicted ester cyclase